MSYEIKSFSKRMSQPMFFFFWGGGKFSHNGEEKKKTNVNFTKAFLEKRKRKWKSCHILMKKGHMLPYLDNEFLLVTRTRQDSKEIKFDLFVLFGEYFWKTLKKKYKFYNFGLLCFCHFSEFLEKRRRECLIWQQHVDKIYIKGFIFIANFG